ncbi:hypothetical protein EGW08_009822, partial [Elysia chlorotica]
AKSKTSKAKILLATASLQLTGSICVLTANAVKLFWSDNDDKAVKLILANNDSNGEIGHWNITGMTFHISLNDTQSFANTINLTESTNSSRREVQPIPFYAFLAMLGYCFVDAGYDFGGCFLKTFVLHCTPNENQEGALVNLNMISSVGAVIISVLASVDVGAALTAGTNYDSNAALALVTSGVSSTLLLAGTIVSVATGFCWKPPVSICRTKAKIEDWEGSVLITKAKDIVTSECHNPSFKSMEDTEQSIPKDKEKSPIHSESVIEKRLEHKTALDILKRYRKQIQLNIMTFGIMSAVTCFGVFCTNFV